MKSLFLDTTTAKVAKVEIKDGEKILVSKEGVTPLETISEALDQVNLKPEDIDEFVANPGPGSYTGIRIGLAVSNALNWVFGKKVAPKDPKYQ
jgi:tRNA A37 threonylcarbamoyladenosine modification protein TsaB